MWLRRPAAVYCQSVSLLVAHGLPHDGAIKHDLDRGHYFRDILRVFVMLFDNSSPSSVKRAAAFRTLMAVIWGIRDLFRVGEKEGGGFPARPNRRKSGYLLCATGMTQRKPTWLLAVLTSPLPRVPIM